MGARKDNAIEAVVIKLLKRKSYQIVINTSLIKSASELLEKINLIKTLRDSAFPLRDSALKNNLYNRELYFLPS